MQIACPIDGKGDSIQKVADIVSSPRAVGRFSGPDEPDGVSTSIRVEGAPDLADRLSPPPEPSRPIRTAYGCFFSVIAFFLVASLAAMIIAQIGAVSGETSVDLLAVALCSGSFAAIALASVARDRRGYSRKWDEYERAQCIREGLLNRWDMLYYCHRHDIIFYRDPETGQVKKSREIKELAFT